MIEKRQETSDSARAVLLNTRSMEHIRRIGLEQTFQDSVFPRDESLYLQIGSSVMDGHVVFSQKLQPWGDVLDGKKGTAFPSFDIKDSVCPSLLCPQFTQEPILLEGLKSRPEASVMWGYEARSLTQDEDGVTLVIKNVSDGEEKKLHAKYLLGCDGGRSWVRKSVGIHTYGKFVVQRACSITFESKELLTQQRKEGKMGFYNILSPDNFGLIITLNTDGMFAFHNILPPGTTDEELRERCLNAKKIVQSAIGRSDIPLTITAADPYNMHALITTKYRVGRVLVVGDAAHQWLPVGGLGLNTGIGDASNLGWKLAAVLQGWGGKQLLESYELERVPIADANRRTALRPTSTPLFGSALPFLVRVPGINFLLATVLKVIIPSLIDEVGPIILGFQYSKSNIVCHEAQKVDAHALAVTATKFVPSSLPGCRAPHVVLSDCPTIHDIFGKCFVLLIIGGEQTDCLLLQEGLTKKGVPFKVRSIPSSPEIVKHYNCKFYLIRPDGIVAWRSDYQPSALEVEENIVPVIRGEIRDQRKLQPSPQLPPSSSPFDFLLNIGLGAVCVWFFHKKCGTNISVTDLALSSLAVAGGILALREWRRRRRGRKPPFMQQVSRHSAWLTTEFGHAANALTLERRFVSTFGPNDVLIRVHAASINPLDTGLRRGYRSLILRYAAAAAGRPLFPFVLGRDCSGEVVAVGDDVRSFSRGDQVYAAVSVTRNGTHAEYACVSEEEVALKPRGISHREAASLPWVAVSVWTALVDNAGLTPQNTQGKRILVHAGSGGVGCFAVQLLKAWGATVTATCSKNNKAFVESLGAEVVLDYTTDDLSSLPRQFDVVLDSTLQNQRVSLSLLKLYGGGVYVTLRSPYASLISRFGGFLGTLLYESYYRYKIIVNRIFGGRGFHYSVAQPSGDTLRAVTKLIETGAVKPILAAVYSMDEMVAAHQHVEGGHTRGKVVVSMID